MTRKLRGSAIWAVLALVACKGTDASASGATDASPVVLPWPPSVVAVGDTPATANSNASITDVASTTPPAVHSLCEDLDSLTKPLIEAAYDVVKTFSRYRARNKAANGTLELLRIEGEFRKDTQAKGESLRAKEATVKAHALVAGEAALLADLMHGYGATATAYEKYAEAFGRGPKGFKDLIGISETLEDIGTLMERLDLDLTKRCKQLQSATHDSDAGGPPTADVKAAASGRYEALDCGSILDTTTKLEWFVGPDRDTTWDDASSWTSALSPCGGGWRMPTGAELRALHGPSSTAGTGFLKNGVHYPAKIDPAFKAIGGGSWVWTDRVVGNTQAVAYNLFVNSPTTVNKDMTSGSEKLATRAFAVRVTRR
jgi:hypothetical protein